MMTRRILIGLFIFVFAVIAMFMITQKSNVAEGSTLMPAVSGLVPGTLVYFNLRSNDQNILSGAEQASEDGILPLPVYDLAQSEAATLHYDFEIEQSADDAIHVGLTLDPKQHEWKVTGSGLQNFSDVSLETIGQEYTDLQSDIRTDWAGLFETTLPLWPEDKSVRLVMYDQIQSDAQSYSPLKIQVLNAPNGGGPGPAGVNQYSCAAPNLSVCTCEIRNRFCTSGVSFTQDSIDMIVRNYVAALMLMTEQFSAVMMQQVAAIGMFFDAKMQLEIQRDMQALQAEAHRDYHPSEQMCQFGSFVKTVAKTEEKAAHDKVALSNILMGEYTGQANRSTAQGYALDIAARVQQYRQVYCDPADNDNGLSYMCDHDQTGPNTDIGAVNQARMNKDIDFTRGVDSPLTLDVDFTDAGSTEEEQDIIALARNLYWSQPFETSLYNIRHKQDPRYVSPKESRTMDSRHILATQNVAHQSFAEIVGMKGRTQADEDDPNGPSFMKALLVDFGLNDDDIDAMLGEYPSYYAQMEVLTKKIYQDPDFYTNLYTKPTNIDRVGVSMDAIKMMQTRDHYEASLRHEMLLSLLIEDALKKHFDVVNAQIDKKAIDFK